MILNVGIVIWAITQKVEAQKQKDLTEIAKEETAKVKVELEKCQLDKTEIKK